MKRDRKRMWKRFLVIVAVVAFLFEGQWCRTEERYLSTDREVGTGSCYRVGTQCSYVSFLNSEQEERWTNLTDCSEITKFWNPGNGSLCSRQGFDYDGTYYAVCPVHGGRCVWLDHRIGFITDTGAETETRSVWKQCGENDDVCVADSVAEHNRTYGVVYYNRWAPWDNWDEREYHYMRWMTLPITIMVIVGIAGLMDLCLGFIRT